MSLSLLSLFIINVGTGELIANGGMFNRSGGLPGSVWVGRFHKHSSAPTGMESAVLNVKVLMRREVD